MSLINIGPACKVEFSSNSSFSTKEDNEEIFLNSDTRKYPLYQFSFHTEPELSPYIIVELPFSCVIKRILLDNRHKNGQENASNLMVQFSLSKEFADVEPSFINDGNSWQNKEINFEKEIITKFIKFSILNKEKKSFHLKKIEIFVDLNEVVSQVFGYNSLLFISTFDKLTSLLPYPRFHSYFDRDLNVIFSFLNRKVNLSKYINYKLVNNVLNKTCSLFINVSCNDKVDVFLPFILNLSRKFKFSFEYSFNSLSFSVFKDLAISSIFESLENIHRNFFLPLASALYVIDYISIHKNSFSDKKFVLIDSDLTATVGLADRIRGILSFIKYCNDLNVPWFIKFSLPFSLKKYYNYKDFSELNTSLENLSNVAFNNLWSRPFNEIFSKSYFDNESSFDKSIEPVLKDLISYSLNDYDYITASSNFGYTWSSSDFFNNFVRTDYLNNELLKFKKIIGFDYISISFRFFGVLGDFNEPGAKVFDDARKEYAIDLCRNELLSFIKLINATVLVLSDSPTFLKSITDIPNVYSFSDNIGHSSIKSMNSMNAKDGEAIFYRTVIDFNLIMDAKEIFLFKTDFLYESNFPLVAACCAGIVLKTHYF